MENASFGGVRKCAPGMILRKSYIRHSLRRSDNESSPKLHTRVPAACVKDRGAPGKSNKRLPSPGDEIHLSRFGYATKESEENVIML